MNDVEEFLKIVRSSKRTYAFTGAGISTPSGIPDFRGKDGLYREIPEDIFDIDKFYENPERYYEVHKNRISPMRNAKPNIAHIVLAKMEELNLIDCVITQNIDGLHKKAGSKSIIRLHGTLDWYVCTKCGERYDYEFVENVIWKDKVVPRCIKCGEILKPDVVFFGEPLPEMELLKAYKTAEESDLAIVIGSSLLVYPAAMIPRLTVENGGKLVIINLSETGLDNIAYRKYEVDIEKFFEGVAEELGVK